ncbi:MAG TPA: autotransporter outer membrane beta-barrel domain-containing protein [Candidatus Helicobacter avistercoris]|nr:autotransporter outer membrane beta-barrel domain-containing protein [Candidatus Helicobacter avistercoris]
MLFKSYTFSFFKPLVASSLAVVLSGGVLSGQDIEVNGNKSQNTINKQGIIFDDGSQSKKLTLTDANNTITSIAFKNTTNPSTNNFLILNIGKTTIANQITVGAQKAIIFALANGTELNLTGGISGDGKSRIQLTNGANTNGSGNTATLSGGTINGTTIEFMGGETQELKLQNSSANLKTIEMNINGSGNKTFTLDTTNNSVAAKVSEAIIGDLLTLNFGGKTNRNNNTASFTFDSTKDSTLKSISIANTSLASDNILTLSAGSLNVTDQLSVESGKGLTLNLGGNATFQGNILNKGDLKINFNSTNKTLTSTLTTGDTSGTTNITISDNSRGGITGAITTNTSGTTNINFSSGSGVKSLTLQGSGNTLSSITLNSGGATTNNTLILQNGTTSIAQAINIQAQQGLTLDLKNGVNLTLARLTNAGSAGVNFSGTSTLTSSITTTAGNTNISLANGANSTITSDVSTSGGETTIVFNGASTLTLNSGNGIITTNGGKTTLDFKSSNGVLKGKLDTQGGETDIQLKGGAKGTITNTISVSNGGVNNIKYNGTSALTLQGSTNAISSLDTSNTQGTLIIDASNNANSTSIDKAILGDKLLVNLGGTSSNIATISLSNTSNGNSSTSSTIKTLTLTNSTEATQNVFSLTGGTTIVTYGVNIGNSQGLSINLSNSANLNSNIKNSSGNTEIHFNTLTGGTIGGTISTTTTLGSSDKGTKINIANGANGTIKGNIITGENANTTIIFETDMTNQPSGNQTSTLTLQGTTNQISTITVNGDSKTLALDGKNSSSGVNVNVKTAITGGKLTAKFDGTASKATNLTLGAENNALKALALGDNSTYNTLTLNSGTTTITDKVTISSNQALDFTLNNNSNLTLTGNLENSGSSTIDFSGNSTLTSAIDTKTSGTTNINILGNSAGAITGNVTTDSSGATNVKYAPNSAGKENSLKLMGSSNTLTSISFDQSARSGKLILGDNASGNNTTITNNISGDSIAGGKLIVEFNGSSHTSHLTLNGSSNALKAIELSGTKNTLTLTTGDTTITDWVRVQTSQGITFDINNANLTFTNSLYNEGGQVYFTLNGNTTIGGDITTSIEFMGTTIYLSNNSSGTNAIFSGVVSKDSQSSMGTTTLQFASGDKNKKITLQGSGNTLSSITLGDTANPPAPNTSTNNTLALTNGNTTIESEVEIQSSQALAFDLENGTNLTLSGNLKTSGGKTDINFSGTSTLSSSINTTSGTTTLNVADSANGGVSNTITTDSGATTNINFKSTINQNTNSLSLNGSEDNQITTLSVEDGGNAQLKGKNTTITTLELGKNNGNSKLTLFNTQSTITTLTPSSSGQTTLSIDGTFNTAAASIANAVTGSNLTLNFNGRGESNKTKLTLQQGSNTLKALTLGANSTANTLSLSTGKTTITDNINIVNNSDITFDLGDSTELALTNGMNTAGTSTLQVIANGSSRSTTLSGGTTTATHLKLTGDTSHSASITLKNPSINLTALTTSGSAENTLTLDTSTQGVETIISQAINGNNLKVELNGVDTKTAKLSLGNTSNGTNTTSTIKTLTLGSNSANSNTAYNTLELKGGNTTITDTLSIEANKGINFDFSGTSSLQNTLTNSAGVLTLNFKQEVGTLNGSISTNGGNTSINLSDGASGIITGSINGSGGTTTISYASGASAKTLTLQGGDNKITQLNIDGTNNTFTLTNGTTTIDGKINIDNGEELTTNLTSTANLTLTGNLDNSGNHTINFNGTSHTLSGAISTLSGGTTSLNLSTGTQATITGDTSSAGITNINLANNASLTLDKKLSTTAGNTTIDFKGESGKIQGGIETTSNATTTFNFGLQDSQIAAATIDGALTNTSANQVFNINAKSTTLKVGDNGLNFSNGNNTININTEDSTLSWQNKNGENKNISTSGGTTKIDFQNSGVIETGIITSGGSTDINVQQNKIATISGNITTSGSGKTNLTFQGSNSTLILKGSSNTLSSVSSSSDHNIISLSEGETHDERTSTSDRRKLTIENITKDSKPLTFISQTTATNADTFLIKGSTTKSRNVQIPSTHSLGIVVAKGVKLSDIGKSGEILVASVKSDLDISFDSTSQVVAGFTTATAVFNTKQTDENGNVQDQGDYTSYFIKGMQNTQVIAAEQEITATAFTLNYDLYMANFNSLNKRMGELRENPHSQGVWLRVFNGALSNDFGLKTKTNYTTIQTGYDYAFGNEGSNNYLGFALSYALSTSTSEHAFDVNAQKRSVDSIYSNAFEVALYNSYVNDEGFYNDMIAKFSYIMSDFKINNLNDPTQITSTTNDTKNFALTLSDEVGYKFALGESKEWGITPQLEVGFGYFNQSNFKQTLQDLGAFLQSNADAVMTVRTRVGSSFSYDFKALSQLQNFNASIYLGAFYEYDYVNGGDITFRTDQITQDTANNLSHLQSDGRVVLNIGTNMNIKENTRIYFDFEKSFMGKINTDYQVNLGVRYSFGENAGYTPVPQPIVEEKKAPLKIQEDSKPL